MANTRISDLTASASNLAASDLVPVVQTPNVGPVKMTGTQIKTGIIGAGSVSIASGKTFTASNTLTLAGTDSTTMTFPTTSATIARTDAGNTFTGAQTFSVGTVNGTGLDISQTWTGTGTYTGLKYNVGTDSGPANAASLLLDLQVGGVSQVRVSKAGSLTTSNITVWSNETPGGTTSKALWSGPNSTVVIGRSGIGVAYATGNGFGFSNSTQLIWGTDDSGGNGNLILTRAANATLRLGAADAAAPVAQTFKVQGVVAGTSNTAGANFTIQGSQGTGTGAGGSIIFQVAPAGSSGTAQNAYSTALTIASDRSVTIPGAATFFSGVAGNSSITIPTGVIGGGYNSAISSGSNNLVLQAGSLDALFTSGAVVTLRSNTIFGFASTTDPKTTSPDTILARDAASTLALRNGNSTGAAQRFNVYNTYTSSTNYETFKIDWITTANTCLIGTEKGSGGGTARALEFQTDGTTRLTIATGGDATFTGNVSASGQISSTTGLVVSGSGNFWINSNTGIIAWGSSFDVALYRDTTSTLALRNGTSAQRFNVYNTYTSSTNYETFKIDWITTANTCLIGTQKGSGGGSARALALQTDGTTRLTIETNGDLTIADAENIIVGSTTGTKIGTATSQKIGFWNATPIVQPTTGVAEAAFVENSGGTAVNVDSTFGGYTLQQVVQALQNAGLLA